MRYTYTAVITPGEGKCYVRVPDITGCVTTGKDIEDAVVQITDALSGCLVVLEDQGLSIPHATSQPEVPHNGDDVLTLISVDTIAYRARTDTRAVRKNVSIPGMDGEHGRAKRYQLFQSSARCSCAEVLLINTAPACRGDFIWPASTVAGFR